MTISEPSGPSGRSGGNGLRVGFVPGVTLTKWRRVWSERFPRLPLDVVEVPVPVPEQRRALDTHLVDMCFIRLPVDAAGLHAIPLYDELPVVVVREDHPVAAFDEVTLAELADENLLDAALADAVDLVAGGAGVLCVPHSIARSHSRRDLVYRPITDAPSTTIALAWLVDNPNELIEEFIGIVRGRTVNSARTARARATRRPDAGARVPPKPSDPVPSRRRGGGSKRAGRRPQGR